MHSAERVWLETNCYIDVWVEVLNALGLDPLAAGACTLSADFQGDQWMFIKYPAEDLRTLYGVEVHEMNIWRSVLDHVEEQLKAKRFITVEVDSWFLPDTAGVSYGLQHTKTTIVPNLVDRDAHRMEYFHGAGYYELSGSDFDGIFRPADPTGSPFLPPYVELVRLEGLHGDSDVGLVERSVALAHQHLGRRPADNPITRLAERIQLDLSWLSQSDLDTFHLYAFGMLRQCGVTAELAADYAGWLTDKGVSDFSDARQNFMAVAESAKSIQFRMARLARGRAVNISDSLEEMAGAWQRAMDQFVAWHDS